MIFEKNNNKSAWKKTCLSPGTFSIREPFHGPVPDEIGVVAALGAGQVHIQVDVVAALHRRLARHLPGVVGPRLKDGLDQGDAVLHGQLVVVHQHIESGLAPHGAKVDDPILLGGVAQQGGDDVLHRVHLGVGEQIPGVGHLEAQIEGHHVPVPAGEIHTGAQGGVVHLKACNFFHIKTSTVRPPGPG